MVEKLKFFLVSLCLTVASLPGFARERSEAGDEEEPFRASFRTYSQGGMDFSGLYYFEAEGEPAPVEVRIGEQSDLHDYEGEPDLVFYRRREVATGEGETEYAYDPVASLPLKERGGEILIFITPRRNDPSGREFNLAAMPSIYEAIPGGHVAFFNGTGASLLGLLGSKRISLKPGINEPISSSGFDDGNHVMLGLSVKYRDSLEVVLQSNVRFAPNRRTLIVLMPPARKDSLNIVAFRITEGA
ncbi:MAG: hypothetical protein ACLFSZ_09895 [Puniceicoccaceae bacterium]